MSIRTIKYTAKYEDLISRIPGLFAYIELDDKGNSVLHKATDSPMGCYGKVIENVKYNGKVYNYKELINRYYNNDISNDLKDFVKKGIGKENVIFDTLDRKKQDLVPDFVYLALVKPLYGEMLKLRDKVNFYKNHIDNRDKIDNETEESLDCVCKLYERHGGDGYLKFLGGLFSKVEDVSNEYFNYANEAVNDGNRFCLNYAVNLFSTIKDMGLVTPMESLVKKPKDKDIVKYIIGRGLDGKTNSKLTSLRRYEGYLNEFDILETPPIGADWLYYYRVGAVRNISTINDENGNIKCENTELKSIKVNNTINDLYAFGDVIESIEPVGDNGIKIVYWTDVHLKAKVNQKTVDDDGNYRIYYKNFEPDYPPIDDFFDENGNPTEKKIASFIWDDEKEQEECQNMTEIKFCDQNDTNNLHGIRYEEIYYFSSNEDEDNISYLLKDKVTSGYSVVGDKVTINDKEYTVVDGKLANEYPVIEDKVTIDGTEYTVEDGKVTINGSEYAVENDKVVIKYDVVDGKEYSVVYKVTIDYTVVGSKVTINGVEYPVIEDKVTIDGTEYTVEDGKVTIDYSVVNNKVTINDKEYTVVDGKVTINDKEYTVVYGKVMIDYVVVGDKVTIGGVEYPVVDGKVTIKDKEYPIIKNKDFYKYVNGDYDDKQANAIDAKKIKKYEKYEFSTNNNTLSYTQRVNSTDLELSCVISDYETICIREEVNEDNSDKNNGVINGVTISRLPFYESISYTPVEKIDVFIDRGSTSVFDRHIRLSEVKTLNDMLEYSNGSYFTMQN